MFQEHVPRRNLGQTSMVESVLKVKMCVEISVKYRSNEIVNRFTILYSIEKHLWARSHRYQRSLWKPIVFHRRVTRMEWELCFFSSSLEFFLVYLSHSLCACANKRSQKQNWRKLIFSAIILWLILNALKRNTRSVKWNMFIWSPNFSTLINPNFFLFGKLCVD